jgi:hypothetical protein
MAWQDTDLEAFAFETISVAGTAVGFTAATWRDPSSGSAAKLAVVDIETAAIRWRADGTDPTATVGHPVGIGGQIKVYGGEDLTSFKMIRQGSTASASVTYYH